MASSERIEWIDMCKGIGILLVVFGHTYIDNPLRHWMYSLNVPIFFFISGYLFFQTRHTSWAFVKNRLLTLVVPYILFAILAYFYWLLIERPYRTTVLEIHVPIFGYLYGNCGTSMDPNRNLWFLTCMFTTQILFFLLTQKIKNTKFIISVLLVSAIYGIILTSWNFRLPWGIDAAFSGIVFYGIGYLVRGNNLISKVKLKSGIIIFIIAFVCSIIIGTFNGKTLTSGMPLVVKGNSFLYYIGAIGGIISIIFITKIIPPNKILVYFGQNTLIIMFLHQYIMRIAVQIASKISHVSTDMIRDSSLSGFLLGIFTMIAIVPFAYLTNRYIPVLVAKKRQRV